MESAATISMIVAARTKTTAIRITILVVIFSLQLNVPVPSLSKFCSDSTGSLLGTLLPLFLIYLALAGLLGLPIISEFKFEGS
jgi:hypothetical protein